MAGYIDLHSHFVPGVDDGVTSDEEAVELCRGLCGLGFHHLVATPHIRDGMFNNRPAGLRTSFEAFAARVYALDGMPEVGLASEQHLDAVFVELMNGGDLLCYPGGHALLVEFPDAAFPLGVAEHFFQLSLRGVLPVVAHPERYTPLFGKSGTLDDLLSRGAAAQLDLMSLTGRYGRKPRKAAERMLAEGAYAIACSDAHRPADAKQVGQAIARLHDLVGQAGVDRLLGENPARLLAGEALV